MAMAGRIGRGRGAMAGNAAEAVRGARNDKATREDGSTASWLRWEKAATAPNYAYFGGWSTLKSIKPPFGGFTGQEVLPYSRGVRRGDVKIAAWRCAVNLPASRLGHPGRGNHAQDNLKPTPGQPACGCAAYRREAQMALEGTNLEQKSPTADGSDSHHLRTICFRRTPSRHRADSPTVIGVREVQT